MKKYDPIHPGTLVANKMLEMVNLDITAHIADFTFTTLVITIKLDDETKAPGPV